MNSYKKSSSCEQNVIISEYCYDPENTNIGDVFGATVFGFDPENTWEVNIIFMYNLYFNNYYNEYLNVDFVASIHSKYWENIYRYNY